MLEWLIIGGGIHGTYLSYVLTHVAGVSASRLRVLDPYATPLALWEQFTTNVGMEFLRSPVVHNLDPDPQALVKFAHTAAGLPHARFTEPYRRPALDLFRAHTQHLIEHQRLRELRVQGRARRLQRYADGFRVETADGDLTARRVLLALGVTEQPYWPEWAQTLRATGAPITHIFDIACRRSELPTSQQTVVIGGGISAAQTALALAHQAPGQVTLVMRHPLRVHQFDSDPGWLGPKYLRSYQREPDYGQRRAHIQSARHRGSVPPDVEQALGAAIASGILSMRTTEVGSASINAAGCITLRWMDGSGTLDAHLVVLATGFAAMRPGGAWLDAAIIDLGLPCAACGYPLVDETLGWYPGLYVSGALAELELGPAARNIAGARMAAERIGKIVQC